MGIIDEVRLGFETAYIDGSVVSSNVYRPQFVSNNHKEGKKVLSSIEDELLSCDQFQISVAFITMNGITPLLQTLKELEKKNIKGKILTTNYLNFSEPRALQKLHELSNITLKMYDAEAAGDGFHTKGYIFRKEELYRIIIGSSNITSAALTSNREWNTKLISTEQGEIAKAIVTEFDALWNCSNTIPFDGFYENYCERYRIIQHQRKIARQEQIASLEKYRLQPNSMQVGFITNLKKILAAGEDRALLISATGTGKTYASAFAMRELGFKRVLFLVHRGQLARQTKRAYEKVFSKSVSMGVVGAGCLEYDADYVFATVQTLNRDKHLFQYKKDEFDCIVLDEAHHVPAETYQKVMKHFTPRLWLGMTATPDKRDDHVEGRNVYELFNYQIAYEIRLQQAMEENLLCPFHYFGITDLSIIGDPEEENSRIFSMLTSDERVRHIIDQADYYGYSGDKVKGLIFCSSIRESEELSSKFNEQMNPTAGRKFRTIALNGNASEMERQDAFERLAMNEGDATEGREPLDYIFSVEILNEGVDIVEVNQVIMLRPTQSPIVFIQQLGRGLRKADGKEYVVILDFIGNYANNFMIPIALSGDRTYNKDNIRRYIMEGERVIPGASTVHFDEISRKKIFTSIDNANFNDIKLIKENYFNLKNKLGRVPSLRDFDDYGEMDVIRIFDNNSLGSYHMFLKKYENDYKTCFSNDEEKILEFVSKKLANGKRIQELQMLRRILAYAHGISERGLFAGLSEDMKEYGKSVSQNQMENIVNVMTNKFAAGGSKQTYSQCVFIEKTGSDYRPAKTFLQMLANDEFYNVLKELVEFGISRYERDYKNAYDQTDFVLYQKYTYEEVCRLLNWNKNLSSVMNGYMLDKKTRTFPVFINYDKGDDVSDTTKYEDHFVPGFRDRLIAISKSGRSLRSEDVQNFLKAKERGIQVELFVRKNKDDRISKEFYYLGHMTASGNTREFIMANTEKTAVEIEWILDTPIREDIYEYIVNS